MSDYWPLNNRAIIIPEQDPVADDAIFESVKSRFTKAKLVKYSTYNENIVAEIGSTQDVKCVIVETHMIEKININSSTAIYTTPINAIVLIEK